MSAAAEVLPVSSELEPALQLPTPPLTPAPDAGVATTAPTPEAPSAARTPSDADEVPHLKVEVPELKEGENTWALLTRFFERFLGHMETYVWPVDPFADVHPTMLPFLYTTPTATKDERFEKELAYLLTIGLQGQAFAWKYCMAFDLYWNTERKGYQVELTSVRRVTAREASKPPVSELTKKPDRSE